MTTDEIRAELQAAIRSDKRAAAILRKIAAGRASFTDTMNYSLISGRLTGQQLSAVILELSEGREELAEALLHDRYEDINAQCAAVQTSLDEKNGLHLAPQKAAFPADRVAKFVHSLVDPTVKDETIKRRARSASENITVTFHDDFIAENAEFRDRAGIECFVERITDGSCCPWCNKVAGRYRMQDQPEGLFSRHDNCGCTIIYDGQVLRGQIGENGRRGRRWIEQPPKVEYQKPTVLSRSEAEKLQAELLPRRLTGGENGGIIKPQLLLEAENPFKNPKTPLKIDSIAQSKHIKGGKRYVSYMRNHEYEPSMLTISEEKAQELIHKYHGTGILKLDINGIVIDNEIIVDNEEIVGYVSNNKNGITQPTTAFKILYSEKGTHMVPTYESQKAYWKERREQDGTNWLLRQKG